MSQPLDNLTGPGKQLKAEAPDAAEIAGLLRTGLARLADARTTSLALGGTSLMRVTYAGDISTLRSELEVRGWRVEQSKAAWVSGGSGQGGLDAWNTSGAILACVGPHEAKDFDWN